MGFLDSLKALADIAESVNGIVGGNKARKEEHVYGEETDYICPDCGSHMEMDDGFYLECPKCGFCSDTSNFDYDCEHFFDEEEYDDFIVESDLDDIPEGCRACGGPYPDCMDSCKMFDD